MLSPSMRVRDRKRIAVLSLFRYGKIFRRCFVLNCCTMAISMPVFRPFIVILSSFLDVTITYRQGSQLGSTAVQQNADFVISLCYLPSTTTRRDPNELPYFFRMDVYVCLSDKQKHLIPNKCALRWGSILNQKNLWAKANIVFKFSVM